MNINDFNIQKEEQVKKINKIIQLAKHNHIENKTKKSIIANGKKAISAINEERKIVYKELINLDFEAVEYDENADHNSESIPTNVSDTRSIENEIANTVTALNAENLKLYSQSIINHSTNDKFTFPEAFKNSTMDLVKALHEIKSDISSIIEQESTEEESAGTEKSLLEESDEETTNKAETEGKKKTIRDKITKS